MNAPLLPEALSRLAPSPQAELPLATDGVLRYVWEGRFGSMLLEVREGQVFVNGDVVVPVEPGPPSLLTRT